MNVQYYRLVGLGCWVGFPSGKDATPWPRGHAADCWTQWRGCSLCCKCGNEETPCHVRRGGSKAAITLQKLPRIDMKLEAFINTGGFHGSSSRTAGHDGRAGHDGHDGHANFFKLGHSELLLGQSLGKGKRPCCNGSNELPSDAADRRRQQRASKLKSQRS